MVWLGVGGLGKTRFQCYHLFVKANNFFSKLLKLYLTNSFYVLWKERNRRIFQSVKCNVKQVTHIIVDNIRNHMLSFSNFSDLTETILIN